MTFEVPFNYMIVLFPLIFPDLAPVLRGGRAVESEEAEGFHIRPVRDTLGFQTA